MSQIFTTVFVFALMFIDRAVAAQCRTERTLPARSRTAAQQARCSDAIRDIKTFGSFVPPLPQPANERIEFDRPDAVLYRRYHDLHATLKQCHADACGQYEVDYPGPRYTILQEGDVCSIMVKDGAND